MKTVANNRLNSDPIQRNEFVDFFDFIGWRGIGRVSLNVMRSERWWLRDAHHATLAQ